MLSVTVDIYSSRYLLHNIKSIYDISFMSQRDAKMNYHWIIYLFVYLPEATFI